MATWSRRLSAAQNRPNLGRPPAGPPVLPEELAALELPEEDREAVLALMRLAQRRRDFSTELTVRSGGGGDVRIDIAHADGRATASVLGEAAAGTTGDEANDLDLGMSGDRVVEMLTDTLVVTSDIVAIFSSVGAEALWANDAFATAFPVRESDRIWLVELLDEWSKAHYEVNVLPALVQHGRWHGRLILEPTPDEYLTVSASIVAHRDDQGEIEAVSLVARDVAQLREDEERARAGTSRLAALVQHAGDIIVVVDAEGMVRYASPAATSALGDDEGALEGTNLAELLHEEDRDRFDLVAMAQPDEDGIAPTTELRFRHRDASLRHLEVVVTDLTDNPAIGGLVLNARDVTGRVEAIAELTERAYTDALTGLPNRVRLLDRLGRVLEEAEAHSVALVLVDLDRFKLLNDAHGHTAGDEALRACAARIGAAVPANASLARLGGNEFAVVMGGLSDVDAALATAEGIRQAIADPLEVGGESLSLTASVGIAVARGDETPEQLVSDAGSAVGVAKERGGNRSEIVTPELRTQTTRRARVEKLLRRVLEEDGAVQVHFQPIVSLSPMEVVAAEALLRVHDDDGALLSPAAFLDAAESTGLIDPLGREVLTLTCRQLAEWSGREEEGIPRQVAVNVSPRQIADPGFPSLVSDVIEQTDVEPARISLELTESMFISQSRGIDENVRRARDLGVQIGLDDFGAGQSSLGYLKRFPLDFVKVDRSLIAGLGSDEDDTAIVRATIELAHNLGLRVVAVGVETQAQLEVLELLDCDWAQGFLFSPAVPAASFPDVGPPG